MAPNDDDYTGNSNEGFDEDGGVAPRIVRISWRQDALDAVELTPTRAERMAGAMESSGERSLDPFDRWRLVLWDELMMCMCEPGDGSIISQPTNWENVAEAFRERCRERGVTVNGDRDAIIAAIELGRLILGVLSSDLEAERVTLLLLARELRKSSRIQVRRYRALVLTERFLAAWRGALEDRQVQSRIVLAFQVTLPNEEEEFGHLAYRQIEEAFGSKAEATRVVARLSVACGAFGDTDETNSYKAFRSASNELEGVSLGRPSQCPADPSEQM